jgi:hypothetical protein
VLAGIGVCAVRTDGTLAYTDTCSEKKKKKKKTAAVVSMSHVQNREL